MYRYIIICILTLIVLYLIRKTYKELYTSEEEQQNVKNIEKIKETFHLGLITDNIESQNINFEFANNILKKYKFLPQNLKDIIFYRSDDELKIKSIITNIEINDILVNGNLFDFNKYNASGKIYEDSICNQYSADDIFVTIGDANDKIFIEDFLKVQNMDNITVNKVYFKINCGIYYYSKDVFVKFQLILAELNPYNFNNNIPFFKILEYIPLGGNYNCYQENKEFLYNGIDSELFNNFSINRSNINATNFNHEFAILAR